MNRRQFTKLLVGAGLLLAGCRAGAAPSSSIAESEDSMQTTPQTYTRTTPIETVLNDPVFGDYGRLIFPVERSYYSGDTLEQLHLTYYNNIDPDETVDICNTLRQRAADGQTIFYDIYTEDEQAADPDKADTGLFYFKGDPGAKFAICNAGGAFAYVGAMQDSFPHALELSRKGYNAFALIYRPGAQTACEDLARAIAFDPCGGTGSRHQRLLPLGRFCRGTHGGMAGQLRHGIFRRTGVSAAGGRHHAVHRAG